MSTWAVVVAAGRGSRMGGLGNKIYMDLCGAPVLVRCILAFENEALIDGIILVSSKDSIDDCRNLLDEYACYKVKQIVAGGDTRQESVYEGLKLLPDDCDIVLVHDGARPFVSNDVILAAIESTQKYGNGIAAIPVTDTLKITDKQHKVVKTPDRSDYYAVQTPQCFSKKLLIQAHESARKSGFVATDDAALVEELGVSVYLSEGSYENIKITTPADLAHGRAILLGESGFKRGAVLKSEVSHANYPLVRVGSGYDVHRLEENQKLILCGVEVPYEKGLLGHSDADVAIHALIDALLGAAGMGDIGMHFSDSDLSYKDISSLVLLERTLGMIAKKGLFPGNADITLVLQAPKLAPYKEKMRLTLAKALGIDVERVNVKAKTTEGLGFEGEGLGVSAQAVVLLYGAD